MRIFLIALGALTTYALFSWWEQQSDIRESDRLLATIERKVAAVDAALYDEYVGVYVVDSKMSIAITREADRLFAQGTQQSKVEIFPASEVTYFNEITNALISFEQDASGTVVGFTLRQPGRLRTGQKAIRPTEVGEAR